MNDIIKTTFFKLRLLYKAVYIPFYYYIIAIFVLFSFFLPSYSETRSNFNNCDKNYNIKIINELKLDKANKSVLKINEIQRQVLVEDKNIAIIINKNDSGIVNLISSKYYNTGFSQKNINIKYFYVDTDYQSLYPISSKIASGNFDIVLVLDYYTADIITNYLSLSTSFKGSIITRSPQNYINGTTQCPKKNITGIYPFPTNIEYQACDLINNIIPLNGNKAVFINGQGLDIISKDKFSKDNLAQSLKTFNSELIDFVNTSNFNEFKDKIIKYNTDPSVGLIILGYPFVTDENNNFVSTDTLIKWCSNTIQKPSVTFWNNYVENGILASISVEKTDVYIQAVDMSIKLLNGEDIKSLCAEAPKKSYISLNKKTADKLGLHLSVDLLQTMDITY